MMEFKHSGATGDIIFSLPLVRQLGGGNMFIYPYHEQRAQSIAKLLKTQPYINDVFITNEIPHTAFDLDKFRIHAGHHENLILTYFKAHNVEPKEYLSGWITLPDNEAFILEPYTIINWTTNYEDPSFDWAAEVKYLLTLAPNCYFIGYEAEYLLFQKRFNTEALYHECDFLGAAELIKNATMFTGCYSAMATIAQGLGVNYRLVQAPLHTCSSLFIEREKIINA